MIERTFIEQGMKKIQLEQYLKKELNRAGFTGLHMVKTPLVTRIVLRVARPGLAIGKGGQNIKQLTEEIAKRFGIDNPQIEIQDIPHPELDARATVDKMVELIERGFRWKSVAFKTVKSITDAGAQGVELVLKGKLSGKGGRKRKHRIIQGYMKKVGDQVRLVDTAKASAYPKAGAIGITLRIIGPGVVFPDKIDINSAIDKQEAGVAKAAEEAKAEADKTAEKVAEAEKTEAEKAEAAKAAEAAKSAEAKPEEKGKAKEGHAKKEEKHSEGKGETAEKKGRQEKEKNAGTESKKEAEKEKHVDSEGGKEKQAGTEAKEGHEKHHAAEKKKIAGKEKNLPAQKPEEKGE